MQACMGTWHVSVVLVRRAYYSFTMCVQVCVDCSSKNPQVREYQVVQGQVCFRTCFRSALLVGR